MKPGVEPGFFQVHMDKYIMNPEIEEHFLDLLRQNNIWFRLRGQRYSGQNQYHNWYEVGVNENYTFGEIEFNKNPIWRLSWYDNGKVYRDSGYLLNSSDEFIEKIIKLSIPGVKKLKIDEKKAEIEKDFI